MDITTIAPVIIPTLNRYEHFKRCLESLEQCTGADKTDVYVALDYPPSEKYVEGWKKIDAYLHQKKDDNNFKNLYVIRRDHNYGVGHANSNASVLLRDIKQKYDYYIFSEDDNEFSPNFLEFMNWGLEKYKDNPNVISICGYNELLLDFLDENIYMHIWYSAWGVGRWFNKWDALVEKVVNEEYCRDYINNCPLSIIFKRDVWLPSSMIQSLRSGVHHGDGLPYRDKDDVLYTIHPKLSMVRNCGADGSGQHGSNSKRQEEQESCNIDADIHFVPSTDNLVPDKRVDKAYNEHFKSTPLWRFFRICDFLSYRLTGHSIGGVYDFYRKHIRKYVKR